MTIGERTIIAEIQKREEARAKYEQAKQEGKSASLLEQQRPNVFQMNVANILPGDEIRTELQYTELISPSEGIYEFVYPTVVGPRYSNQSEATAPPSEQWSKNPYLHQGEQPPYTFDMAIRLTTGVPIQEMTCASHQVDIRYEDPSVASVALAAKEKSGGNRDFILKYRLAGAQIDSGLLLYEGKEENFFLLMVQPPKRFEPGQVPPREYIFIVDVSGSMHGFPLDISKRLLRDLLGNLRPIDAFNVLLFSGGSQLLAERSLPATAENVKRAMEVIDNQQGGGGTELLPALKRALQLPRSEKAARTLVIATDGYVTVEPEAFDLIRKGLGSANFFSFGIGSSVNRFLIEGMARAGAGEPFIITKPHEASAVAEKFRKTIESPLLTQIRLNLGTFDAYDVGPSAVPDVFAERPVVICGKWRGRPEGSITLQGIAGSESYSRSINTA
ncbi:MAG TPA: VIT and VWA domain-containing protein, partial [Syntrophobacteraceae bacterium]|nr:VIT and VWA domain-containing protein [Syntrophobacteraceae bacterium]